MLFGIYNCRPQLIVSHILWWTPEVVVGVM